MRVPSTVETELEHKDKQKEEDAEKELAKKKKHSDDSGHQPATKSYPTRSKGGPAFTWSKTLSVDAPLEANKN